MVVRIASLYKTLAAGASETEIGSITCKAGYEYKILEVLPVVPSNSLLYIYVESDRVATIHGDLITKDNRRILVDWLLRGGESLKISGTNGSGSSAVVGALIVYEETPVA